MINVGMDVHQYKTTIDLYDPEASGGQQRRTVTVETTREGLESALKPLNGRCRVCFEVGPQSQWVASVIRPLCSEMVVANASRISWLFKDGRKNDKLDARKLSTLLHLKQVPAVHLPPADVSIWRSLINYRRSLVQRRTRSKNQVRGLLRACALRCPYRSCWTVQGRVWLRSLTFDDARQLMMKTLLQQVNSLNEQIAKVEAQLDRIAEDHDQVELLQTIVGVGPRTAEAVVAFTDDIKRFCNRKKFASYFGMAPTLDASGRVERHGHISKRGPSVVRWVVVEAVHRVVRHCQPMREQFERLRRGLRTRYKKAIVAMGRKLLTIMFAMMRDQTPFDEKRVGAA